MKRAINVWDYSQTIVNQLIKGVLITSKADDQLNTMTISWGALGMEWRKPIFTAYVRGSRFSYPILEKNPEFTINIPMGEYDKKILDFCGTKSGRDVDKFKELGLTLVEPEIISVPAIKELPLTLECKIIYKQEQDPKFMKPENNEKFYPMVLNENTNEMTHDYHMVYYGEIVAAYIIED